MEEEDLDRQRRPVVVPRVGEWNDGWHVRDPIFIPTTKEDELEEGKQDAPHIEKVRYDDLTDEQKKAFDLVADWQDISGGSDNLLTLGGYAGTGKSTILSLFAEISRKTVFCCFTAKATDVLRKKMRLLGMPPGFLTNNVRTIHSLIYIPVLGKKGEVVRWERRKPEDVRKDFERVVIDEASMVNDKMLEDFHEFDLPILAVGDHGQLPPVDGKGSIMLEPDIRLETIHRQAKDNPIIALAHQVRTTGHLPDHKKLPKDGPIQYVRLDKMPELMRELYDTYAPNEVALLTYMNSTRQKLNCKAREVWLGTVEGADAKEGISWGEQVICLKNHKRTVFNGMRGTVLNKPEPPKRHNKYWFETSIDFPDHAIRMEGPVLAGQFGRNKTFNDLVEIQKELKLGLSCWPEAGLLFDYGYCLTVHKSQGSGFKAVVLKFERPGPVSDDDFRRWLYTAVTRAIDKLYIIV